MLLNKVQRNKASTTHKKEQKNKVWVYTNTCTAYEGSLSHIPFLEEKIKCQFYNEKHELITLEKIGTTAHNNRKTKGLHFKPMVASTKSYSLEAPIYTNLSTPSITALPAIFVDSFENENATNNYGYSSNYSTQTQNNLTQEILDISETEPVLAGNYYADSFSIPQESNSTMLTVRTRRRQKLNTDNPCFDNINLNNLVTSINAEDDGNCYSFNAFNQTNRINNQRLETAGQQLEHSLDVHSKNLSELQKTLTSLNPNLTSEKFQPMSIEENYFLNVTYLPPGYLNYFNEPIEESPYPEYDTVSYNSTEEVTLDEETSCEEDVNLEALTSWPDDLVLQDSTDVSFAEGSPIVDYNSRPNIELEESARQYKNVSSSSSFSQSFFNSTHKRSSPEEETDDNYKHAYMSKVAK
ncbi:Uncharacterised protein [Legionella busanensis]|uniref:Uncharacterized protein n=2 Tax=Legionella busanensis TaxID=190655 RepID=A0A378JPL7_9GAMM|nr:hypothetical protein [Legionella busanensis]STX52139.1 Uncharacterised protein [Legionella busanensis]